MSSFVFTIDSATWDIQSPNYSYPISNLGNSFSNLNYSFVTNQDSTTTITISWFSYTDISSTDGLLFNQNVP